MISTCEACALKKICKKEKIHCEALRKLCHVCDEEDMARRRELIIAYAKDLGIINFEVSPALEALGKKVIAGMDDLQFIPAYDIRIGYVMSYEHKRNGRKTVFADCRKVVNVYTAYLPFHFIVTFYWPNMGFMSDNQKKLLMYHELQHIGVGERGLRLEPHDVDDFVSILQKYGLDWDGFGHDVPDILASGGGDGCKCSNTN